MKYSKDHGNLFKPNDDRFELGVENWKNIWSFKRPVLVVGESWTRRKINRVRKRYYSPIRGWHSRFTGGEWEYTPSAFCTVLYYEKAVPLETLPPNRCQLIGLPKDVVGDRKPISFEEMLTSSIDRIRLYAISLLSKRKVKRAS